MSNLIGRQVKRALRTSVLERQTARFVMVAAALRPHHRLSGGDQVVATVAPMALWRCQSPIRSSSGASTSAAVSRVIECQSHQLPKEIFMLLGVVFAENNPVPTPKFIVSESLQSSSRDLSIDLFSLLNSRF